MEGYCTRALGVRFYEWVTYMRFGKLIRAASKDRSIVIATASIAVAGFVAAMRWPTESIIAAAIFVAAATAILFVPSGPRG